MTRWTEADYAALEARKRKASPLTLGCMASEHDHQFKLVEHCKAMSRVYPELSKLYAIPNGGKRAKRTGATMKSEGVKAGVFDLHLPVSRDGYLSLYVEMKKTGGTISESQYRFMRDMEAEGHRCEVAWGAVEAWKIIEKYLRGDKRQ